MEAVAEEHRVRLLVKGPGQKRAAYEFATMTQLEEHHASIEQQLISQGFTLETFVTERRRWPR